MVPAAAFMTMAVEAVRQVIDDRNAAVETSAEKIVPEGYTLNDFNVKSALTVPENGAVEMIFRMMPVAWTLAAASQTAFEFNVGSYRDKTWIEHAVGTIRIEQVEPG